MPSVILGICAGTAILWIVSKMEDPPSRNSNNINIRKTNTNINNVV